MSLSHPSVRCTVLSALAFLSVTLSISGCRSAPPVPVEDATPDAEVSVPEPAQPANTATLALLSESEQAMASGNLEQAISYAERAVRIEPSNPRLWLRLAELHLQHQNPDQAIEYANKTLSLDPADPGLTRDAWLVIADAMEQRGNQADADAIRQQWQTLSG